MQEFLSGAGLPSEPVISVLQAVDAPGTFWDRALVPEQHLPDWTEGTVLVSSVDPGEQL